MWPQVLCLGGEHDYNLGQTPETVQHISVATFSEKVAHYPCYSLNPPLWSAGLRDAIGQPKFDRIGASTLVILASSTKSSLLPCRELWRIPRMLQLRKNVDTIRSYR